MSEVARAPQAKRLVPARVLEHLPAVPPIALAYALPAVVAAVAVQMWFRNGGVLASGDLTPPVPPGTDYRSHWNQFDTGAGAPSFQIVSLPYFEALRLFARLGLSEPSSQRVWLTLLAAGAAAAVVFLARGVVSSALAVGVAGFLAMFNAYRLTAAFDSVALVAMIEAAILGGLVIRAGRERGPRPLVFALASTGCAFVFLNPPHLALVLAWVGVCAGIALAVHGRPGAARLGRFLLVAVPTAILFNLWWIVPAMLAIANPLFHSRLAAAGVDEWAWTHARADPLNVIALTSSWAWGRPEYFPFSTELERFPFTVLQYVPFAAAALGLALARRGASAVALVLAAAAVITAWIMKGLHPPLSGTNKWFYDHFPGFWLLREPTKAGLLLTLSYALLAALGVARLVMSSRRLGYGVAAAVVGSAGVYAHALLSGGVVPTNRPLLPSAHVRIPDGWSQAATFVDSNAASGKIVVLPRLDYYQAATTWGYYGATFLHQLISRPVIDAPLPGGYYRDPVVPELLAQLERRILSRNATLATLLQALGSRYILLRRDLAPGFLGRSFASPDRLAANLERRRDVRLIRSFGVADLFEVTTVRRRPEVYPVVPLIAGAGAATATLHAGVDIGADAAVVQPAAQRLLADVPTGAVGLVSAVPFGPGVVADIGETRIRFQSPNPVLRRRTRRDVSIPAPSPPYRLLVGSDRFVVKRAPKKLRPLLAAPTRVPLRRGFLAPVAVPFTPALARRVGDCHKTDERTLRQAGIAARVVARRGRAALRLRARAHSACISLPIGRSPVPGAIRLRLSYRTVRGNPARVCIWQTGPNGCAPHPTLSAVGGWHEVDAVIPVATGTQALHLFLYADAGGRPTVTEYAAATVARPIPTIGVAVAPLMRLPHVSYQRVSPSKFRVHVRGARRPFVLAMTETFARGWRLDGPADRPGEAAHVRVNGYANGWRVPWSGSYELTIEYRPERLARVARRLDLVLVPLGILALLWPRPRSRPRRDRACDRAEATS